MQNQHSGESPSTATAGRKRVSDILEAMDALSDAIRSDRQMLAQIGSPLDRMTVRAETAEAAAIASDKALSALKILQNNSLQTIKAGNEAIAAMKAAILKSEAEAESKTNAILSLERIIRENTDNLKASALAFHAVNELAFYDPLTGLPNRRLLDERLKQMIGNNKRWGTFGAAIFMDLDKFKRLNDVFGHEAGDELLIAVGKRLQTAVRQTDTVARYGGDEFVILIDRLNGTFADAKGEAEVIATKILGLLTPPYTLNVRTGKGQHEVIEYQAFASLGVAMFDGDDKQTHNILDWADEAMYQAKSEGGSKVLFYDVAKSTEETMAYLYNLATQNDIETANHGIRMRQYVKTLANRAKAMNLFPDELNDKIIEQLFKTTQLHDIGKIRIPFLVLHKQGKLTADEWDIMKTHTTRAVEILEEAKKQNASLCEFLDTAIAVAESHHEHWDGTGYPKGLAGTAIPLAGRLLAIADVYDALISKRSYKQPWKHEDAMAEITAKSGSQFDPLLVEALVCEDENFRLIAERARD